MYSMVLFIVDTSFSGVLRSGHSPTSAALRWSAIMALSARPVNVT